VDDSLHETKDWRKANAARYQSPHGAARAQQNGVRVVFKTGVA
jgi:hypothetical protein